MEQEKRGRGRPKIDTHITNTAHPAADRQSMPCICLRAYIYYR